MTNLKLLKLSVACMLLAGQAHAAIDWSLNTSSNMTAVGSSYGNSRTYTGTGGSTSVNITAWANTSGTDGTTSVNNNQSIESAYLGMWTGAYGGLGVKNRDAGSNSGNDQNENSTPEHAIDNNQRYDMVLMSFSDIINLKTIDLSWIGSSGTSGSSDITVLAYTGSTTGAIPLGGLRYNQLTSNGWSLVGHYADIGAAPFTLNTTTNSSYWLVGAYNPLVGSPGVNSNSKGTLDKGNDYIKLAAVSGTKYEPPKPPTGQVPEPATLAITGLALVGMMGLRRRKQA